jgi:membrane protein DedA with SNARE-associated domain
MKWRAIWQTPRKGIWDFFVDDSFTLAAALAFYAMLSLAPLLVLSWLPVLGEALTLVAGLAKVRLAVFTFWTVLGRALRMLGLVHLSFLVF